MELFLLVTLMVTVCSFVPVTGISRKPTYIRATVFFLRYNCSCFNVLIIVKKSMSGFYNFSITMRNFIQNEVK